MPHRFLSAEALLLEQLLINSVTLVEFQSLKRSNNESGLIVSHRRSSLPDNFLNSEIQTTYFRCPTLQKILDSTKILRPVNPVEALNKISLRKFLAMSSVSSSDTATSLSRFSERTTWEKFFSCCITFFSFTQVIERLLLTKSSLDALTKIPCGLEYECFLSLLE